MTYFTLVTPQAKVANTIFRALVEAKSRKQVPVYFVAVAWRGCDWFVGS